MPLTVPTALKLTPWFQKNGEVQQSHFTEPPRESQRNNKSGLIPLTSCQYMLFGDVGIPCQSPDFPKYYQACNKIYIALQLLAKACASTEDSERALFFADSAHAFEDLEDFLWEVPEKSKFPTFCDNRKLIAAALKSVSLYYTSESLMQVDTIDQIIALNDEATTAFQMLVGAELLDTKHSLLSSRACAESDKYLKICQTNPSADDVAMFVQHAATAIVLREKVEKPTKELVSKCEELVGVLTKYHREAYESFLASYKSM